VGLGVQALSDRPGDLQNSFNLPAYTRWDMGLYYRRRSLTASLYLENLFSEQYYVGTLSSLQIFPGAPFNTRMALRWDF